MNTIRLYEENAYLRTFTAQVLSCKVSGDEWKLVLNQTAFFPEGGGQPCDLGTIDEADVLDVQLEDNTVIHTVNRSFEVGTHVTGTIDWARRFDHMQQHSGEHIVSGLIHERFGYDNVGFHMGRDVVTVDWNGPMTSEELHEIEAKANSLIWENLETEIFFPTDEEQKTLVYRSKKEIDGALRIVRFPGADTCACCGTHVARAGEIGEIRLISLQKLRGGIRVEMLSGRRAYEYSARVLGENHKISVLLSGKGDHTSDYVQKLYDEHQALKERAAALEGERCDLIAEKYKDKGNVLLITDGMDSNELRRVTIAVMEICGGICAGFAGADGSGYASCVGQKNGDVRALVKDMNSALSGRGGGKPLFAQGKVNVSADQIRTFFAERGFSES